MSLQRFVDAQEPVIRDVRAELKSGRKQSHWMWFVFPQLRGLGRSETSQYYGIDSRIEAEEYLNHAVLGGRLTELTCMVNSLGGRSATDIFGSVDALKFCSSMTLFAEVAPDRKEFDTALQKYFDGKRDPTTQALLKS